MLSSLAFSHERSHRHRPPHQAGRLIKQATDQIFLPGFKPTDALVITDSSDDRLHLLEEGDPPGLLFGQGICPFIQFDAAITPVNPEGRRVTLDPVYFPVLARYPT